MRYPWTRLRAAVFPLVKSISTSLTSAEGGGGEVSSSVEAEACGFSEALPKVRGLG